jgi:hypothetical protein
MYGMNMDINYMINSKLECRSVQKEFYSRAFHFMREKRRQQGLLLYEKRETMGNLKLGTGAVEWLAKSWLTLILTDVLFFSLPASGSTRLLVSFIDVCHGRYLNQDR